MRFESLQYKESKPRAYELPCRQKSHTRLTVAKRRKESGRVIARELMTQASSNGKHSGLPRFYFIAKQCPPKIQHNSD